MYMNLISCSVREIMVKSQQRKTARKSPSHRTLYAAALIAITLSAALIAYYVFFLPDAEDWAAAIVDQISIENLFNPEFNTTVTSLLNASGFSVKYYPGEAIDIDFYETLPSKSGKVVLLRVHSTVRNESDSVDLFTSEDYSKPLEFEYAATYGDQISVARFIGTNSLYFAVGPAFVDRSMRGFFDDDCVIFLMGCKSLNKTTMAAALESRGAKAVIGWTDWIDSAYTDHFTERLLQYLLGDNPYTISGAVTRINEEIADLIPDPARVISDLDYYPNDAADYKLVKRPASSFWVGEVFQACIPVAEAETKQQPEALAGNSV
jgi:hypothetical protein